MTYQLIMRITDLVEAVEDYKRNLITEEDLKKKIFECYKALENSEAPKEVAISKND